MPGDVTGSEQREAFELLATRIHPEGKLLRTWELEGGVTAEVTAFEIARPDGGTERLVARRQGSRRLPAGHEFRLLQLLSAHRVPAPRPRYLDAGGEIFSAPCVVVDYVDGRPGPASAEEAEFLRQFTTALAGIHRVDRSTANVSFLPELELDAEVRRHARVDGADAHVRHALEAAPPLARRNASVLLHGDFWPGNTLWKNGRLVAVVDWEDAAVGDPIVDVANARLELLWALGEEAMEEFTRRYRVMMPGVDLTDLPHWELRADLRLSPRIADWGLDEATERTMRAGREAFVAQALERLTQPARETNPPTIDP